MAIPLYPYQEVGAQFLANAGRVALLADDMGIGKTAQAVRACDIVDATSIIVICPMIARINWAREFARFSDRGRKCTVLTHPRQPVPDDGVVIASYEGASSAILGPALKKRGCDVLIIDEAHYCKERDSGRTLAILGPECDGRYGIAQFARRIWALTGTPTPNHQGEMYPLLKLSGRWRHSYWDYMREFTRGKAGLYGYKVTGARNVPKLRELMSGFYLRRKREEVLSDLPSLTVDQLVIPGTEVNPSFPILEKLRENEPAAAKLIEEAMATDDWSLADVKHVASVRRLIGLAKVRNIADYVSNELRLNPQTKMVLFCIHRDVLKYLHAYLAPYRPRILYGGTDPTKKQLAVDSFQTNYKRRVLLCQIKTAGTAITLTASHRILIVEPSWTPADNWQAICRVHRIGQKKPVLAQLVSLSGSIDEAVNRVLLRKTEAIQALFE